MRHLQRDVRLPGLSDAEAIHAACSELVAAGWLIPPVSGGTAGRQGRLHGQPEGMGNGAMSRWAAAFRP